MGTIATTTQAAPFDYPSQAYMDFELDNGNLWCMVHNSSGNFEIFKSTDGGSNWTSQVSLTRANVQEYSRIFVSHVSNTIHWAYRTNESNQDRIYYRKLNMNTLSWSSELLVASPSNGGVAGAYHTGIDMSLDYVGTNDTTYIVVAVGTVVGANHGVTCYGVLVNASGTASVNNGLITGTRQWLHTGSGRITPSIDKEHIGDSKTKGTGAQNLWLAWGRTKLYMVKLTWASGHWTGPTSATQIASTLTPAQDSVSARWDGERFLMVAPNPSAGSLDTVVVYERNRANTTTTTRTSPAHTTGTVRNCGVNYNSDTGDIRVYAVGTSTGVLYYVDFVRATGLWSSWAQVVATAILGSAANNWGTMPSTAASTKFDVYTAASGAPNTLTSTRQGVQYPPNIPTWATSMAPSGSAANVGAALLLDWVFNDPDPTDTQSAWALSRQIGSGTIEYRRDSDNTWQLTEQKNVSGSTEESLASGWGADADAQHTYKVKVWDSADVASSYSDAYAVIPSAQVNPSITAPTEAQVIGSNSVTVTWTMTGQSGYKLILKRSGAIIYDSGWVTSTDLSHTPPVVLVDGASYVIELQTKNAEGLASTVQTRNFSVDFVEPPAPTIVLTPLSTNGYMSVAVTNPAPSGSQPAFAEQALYRRPVGPTHVNVNPFFETDLTDWALVTATSLTRSNVQAHQGSWSARLVPDGTSSFARVEMTSFYTIDPSLPYHVEGWIRPDTDNKPVRVYIAWFTSGEVFVSRSDVDMTSVAGVWLFGQGTFVPPPTAAKLKIGAGIFNTPAAGDGIYVDELTVREADPGEGVRIAKGLASGVLYADKGVIHGVAYEYRSLVTAANGTSVYGPWTA